VSTKSITTNVGVREGRSLIIGGLISTTKNNSNKGVPGVSHIPFFGKAFKYDSNNVSKTELIIIITPQAVNRS
jgi:type II secretory pathway component GspD/PulD (secretin)